MSDGDEYPFDRDHWSVGVNFPVSRIGSKDELYAVVRSVAERTGGTDSVTSEPLEEFLGRPGCESFGMAVVFEAGDANVDGFIRWTKEKLAWAGVSVDFDPEDVIAPDREAPSFRR